MSVLSRRLLPLFLALVLPFAAAAQHLPSGEVHATRERSFDLQHFRADLAIDPAAGRVSGAATLTLAPLRPLTSLCLDAVHLEVDGVELSDQRPLVFHNDGHQLCVDLPEARGRGSELTLTVRYRTKPRAGMYFQADPGAAGRFFVTTYGEGGLHANWLPIYSDNNDKFSTEMVITVPAPYAAVSNGTLVEERVADGQRIFHWKQQEPHSNYLIAVYVGDFERGELSPALGEIPLAYWVPRGRLEEGAYAFRNTTRMVEHFSRLLDYRYPWVVYDQLAIPDYAIGAMEHTGITGHNASVLRLAGQAPVWFGNPSFDDYHPDWTADATISHELAHHWFGDNTTCAHLGEIWLNESFASYLMMLWAEEDLGPDQLDFDVDHARRQYFRYVDQEHVIRPLRWNRFDSPNDIYNEEHTYLKGAAVLHMLRRALGDEAFFAALSDFLHQHELAPVESSDLRESIQRATGRNVDWFFEGWVDGGGHPDFEVEAHYLPDRQLLDLVVRQVQPRVEGQGLFRLPVTLTLATSQRRWEETLWVSAEEEKFLLPVDEEPLLVSFDGQGALVAEIDFPKPVAELVYQLRNDALAGRLRALRQLVERFPQRPETRSEIERLLAEPATFWGLRAEAARALGELGSVAAEELASRALGDAEQRVRKAAVLGLGKFGTVGAEAALRRVVAEDGASDVVGAALVALARSGAALEVSWLREVMGRESWYEELAVAGLVAIEELDRDELLPLVPPYVKPPHNQEVRAAALRAWAAISPADPALRSALVELLASPSYVLQQLSLEMVGELFVEEARPALERLVELDVDDNLTQLAKQGLEQLGRLDPAATSRGAVR